jgi:hypothetical protein
MPEQGRNYVPHVHLPLRDDDMRILPRDVDLKHVIMGVVGIGIPEST